MHNLSETDINFIIFNEVVIENKKKLQTSNMVYFNLDLPDSVKSYIKYKLGLDLFGKKDIPMRWIKGDTPSHIDSNPTHNHFENTYLVYLTDSEGELIIDGNSNKIIKGSTFKFNEGLPHETINTCETPRLLIGPMNELAEPVGAPHIYIQYFPSLVDSQDATNIIGTTSANLVLETKGGYSSWTINFFNSSGWNIENQPPDITYNSGFDLGVYGDNGASTYYVVYAANICFLENSTILCLTDSKEKYTPIQNMKEGDLVKISTGQYKKVKIITNSNFNNINSDERIKDRLYICKKENYPELTEDLVLTGAHSILVKDITNQQREKTKEILGNIYITDKYYRLIACIDDRAECWINPGNHKIWHFALESDDDGINYGVYANGGLLVETISIRSILKSNLKKL